MSKTQPTVQPSQQSKAKKVEWYATQLMNDAIAKDKAGAVDEAVADYLKAAEFLMLLAKAQQNYTVWKGFADKATSCQKRVRELIAMKKD
jgi:hypothetical protein